MSTYLPRQAVTEESSSAGSRPTVDSPQPDEPESPVHRQQSFSTGAPTVAARVSRTPSAVDFPGAFTTRPKTHMVSLDKVSLVPRTMKNRVTEAVGGGLANVVGGVYSLVSYVNPLGGSGGAASSDTNEADAKTESPLTPETSEGSASSSPAMLLQPPSAGTSVAADLDEKWLADANADNPESNRPPTPTKASFTRMLRFPSPGDSLASGSGAATAKAKAKAKAKEAQDRDPVSRNVSQRTGHQFLPGAEERRRYQKRVGKAPQLDAHDASDDGESDAESVSSASSDDQQTATHTASAGGVDSWRFLSPRTKRVKRRALWRMFLAQEIAPAVYDELQLAVPGNASPMLSPVGTMSGLKKRAPSIAPSVDTPKDQHASGRSGIWAMEFSVCGRYLAAGGQDGVVRVWRLQRFAQEQARKDEAAASAQPPLMPRMRTAGNHASTLSDTDPAAFANSAPVGRAKHLRSFSMGQPPMPSQRPQSQQVRSQPHAASPKLRPQTATHPLHAYELLEPVPFRSYVGHGADVLSLSWSKNGFLLSASADRTVRLWHPHRPECLCTFRHRDIVTSVAFSPRDDRLFVSGSLDCRLRLWDIPARGVRHWTGLPDGQMVTAVGFTSARGDLVVAGTYRGMCVFYSTHDLSVQGRMHARSSRGRNAQGSKITGFAYAPTSEQRLLVSSNDSRLRMFLPAQRTLGRKYKGHANASSQAYARLSADARYIVSGSEDHNVYVWPVAQDNAATPATHPAADHIRRGRAGSGAANAAAAAPGDPADKGDRSLLGSLFRRARSVSQPRAQAADTAVPAPVSGAKTEKASGSPAAPADPTPSTADPTEWESLDGRVEEKSIYEYFSAHDAPVSQALFVPASTLQYLADHNDPILSRPKLRQTSKQTGEVENLCRPTADGLFSQPLPTPLPSPQPIEDMTAIIVSADTKGNIRVFRKDINAPEVPVDKSWCENGAKKKESDASSVNSGSAATSRSRPASIIRAPFSLTSASSASQLHNQPPSLRGSPSLWSRLGRRVSQKRASSHGSFANSHSGPSPLAKDFADQPVGRESLDNSSGACAYCGHRKLIEFTVTSQAATESNGDHPRLLVCEKCKRVCNMPVTE
ncbi:hypothetical protein IWW45_001021 [Coemansia sp. RSA 485]|nr:hypothetical protein IWW45_001021 [Coemansia sp. RSA 485]